MHKEIVLAYDKNLNDKDLLAVQLFNANFNENEIKLEPDSNRI